MLNDLPAVQIEVLKALSSLVTALYTGSGTTMQQDRAILQQLDQAQAQAQAQPSAASTSSSNNNSSSALTGSNMAGEGALGITMPAEGEALGLAVRFRLSQKQTLEAALKALRARSQELASL